MDPSIMKLLEEDEDESMHSGADVEAFTAALNRDIEGGSLCSHPAHPDISSSQENNQMSSQTYSQWQPSSLEGHSATHSHQQALSSQQQQPSKVEMKEQESSMEIQQEANASQEASDPYAQLPRPVQADGKGQTVESYTGDQPSIPIQSQASGLNRDPVHDQSSMLNTSSGSQFSNMRKLSNQQDSSSVNQGKGVSIGHLLPLIIQELEKDKAMQLQTLYERLRKNEIPKDAFLRLMRNIAGDQKLRLAVVKMQAKSQTPRQQPNLRLPAGSGAQFSDPYSFGQLHQKSHSTLTLVRTPASVMLPVKDSGHPTAGSNLLKPREIEHVMDSCGVQANQLSDSATSLQGLSKEQQKHLHFQQGSVPMYAATSYHSFTGTNVSAPLTLAKPQSHEPLVREGQLHQGFGSVHGDIPKVDRQISSGDSKRYPSVTIGTPFMQHTPVPWQVGIDQKLGASPNMSFVKQEPTEQGFDKPQKPPISSTQGHNFAGAVLDEQGESLPIPPSDAPSSNSLHKDANFQVRSQTQSVSADAMDGKGSNPKASNKMPFSGRKKPLDALASSPNLPSKKPKVSGAFADQSIEHLNDVTAVSGVNLREEEEQLLSGPKDDSRVSEAFRKAVQEEEDRLILQKAPLQKKLAEIMMKYGLKNLSNDVERCLSLCVEERMRGLISSLIRLSKQQADSEKSRHATVVTSDVREQIIAINRRTREEWDKKHAEAEKLRKQNEPDSTADDVDKEKDEGRAKSLKMQLNKEEDDKMLTTAANVAARAAVGGDDMLSKWQLMAQARQKREVGPESAINSSPGIDITNKQVTTSNGNVKETRRAGKMNSSSALSASVEARRSGRSQVGAPPNMAAPRISVKDVIAVLEREPQMAKSTIIYRLYDRVHADSPTK